MQFRTSWCLMFLGSVVFCFGIVSAKVLDVKFQWKQLDFAYPNENARQVAINNRQFIPTNNVPVGLEVWRNKLFITVPRWKHGVPASLAYVDLQNNEKSPKLIPYPSWAAHNLSRNINPRFGGDDGVRIVSPFRIRADACNRLWVLDTGKTDILGDSEQFGPNQLLVYDLMNNELIHKYEIPEHFMKNDSFFANIAVDVKNGKDCEDTFAYLADLGASSMVVYNWRTKTAWRVTHNYFLSDPMAGEYDVAGVSFQWTDGLFGLALSEVKPDGYRTLFFHPFSSFSEFSVSTKVLQNEALWKNHPIDRKIFNEFKFLGRRKSNTQSCASFVDEKSGVLFYTQVTQNSVGCWKTANPYNPMTQGQIGVNDVTMVFPNDIKIDEHRNLWVLTDKMAIFMYKSLNPSEYNFHILSAPVDKAIKGTVCAGLVSSGNKPSVAFATILMLTSIIYKYFA